jgi:hypothetical protein
MRGGANQESEPSDTACPGADSPVVSSLAQERHAVPGITSDRSG